MEVGEQFLHVSEPTPGFLIAVLDCSIDQSRLAVLLGPVPAYFWFVNFCWALGQGGSAN